MTVGAGESLAIAQWRHVLIGLSCSNLTSLSVVICRDRVLARRIASCLNRT